MLPDTPRAQFKLVLQPALDYHVYDPSHSGLKHDSPLFASIRKRGVNESTQASNPSPLKKNTLDANTEKTNPRRWGVEEDEALRAAVENSGERNWKAIADQVEGRSHTQCLQRWTKVLKPGLIKGQWTPVEDTTLRGLVAKECKNWAQLAAQIPGRTAKQCRERWCNHLDPSINKGPYTAFEDKLVMDLQAKLGNRWSVIAQSLPGRTEDAVKIRWKSLKRSQNSEIKGTPDRSQEKVKNSTPVQRSRTASIFTPFRPLDMKYAANRPSVTMDQIISPKSKWLQKASSSIVDIPDAESVLSTPRPISRRSRAVSESKVLNYHGWGNANPTVALLTSKVGQKEDLIIQQRQRLMAMEREHVLPATQRVDFLEQRLLTATLKAARARQQKLSKLERGWKTAKSPLQKSMSMKHTNIDKYLSQVLPASSPTVEFMGSDGALVLQSANSSMTGPFSVVLSQKKKDFIQ